MDRFGIYATNRWRRLRKEKLAADPFCQYHSGGVALATEVDHRVAIGKGGDPWAWENLVSCCRECHSKKTFHIDIMGRDHVPVKGVDASTGLPLDPGHWWRR